VGAQHDIFIKAPQLHEQSVADQVRIELTHIIESDLFRDTTRLKRFLTYIVTETLNGRGNRLKGYSLGVEVFDKADDFDPQADTIVRVQAGQLRRRLDLYYATQGVNNTVRILVPKGSYVPVFEMRKKLSDLTAVSEPEDNICHAEVDDRPGIAVMTFDNLSLDSRDSFFAEGLTTEIINALVQFRYLRIVARPTNLGDPSKRIDIKTVSKNCNVQFILSGSVRRIKNLARVSVNLINAKTGVHIFTRQFDRDCTPENLFEIQENIASYTAASVAAPFGVVNRVYRKFDPVLNGAMPKYEIILRYYDLGLTPQPEVAQNLLTQVEETMKMRSQFSTGWAVMSLLNIFLATMVIPPDDGDNRLKQALKHARRAVTIDPDNHLAYSALFRAFYHAGQVKQAEKMAARAIFLNPNDYNMLAYLSVVRAFQGQCEKAILLQKTALDLIGRPPLWFHLGGLICAFQRLQFAEVLESVKDTKPETLVGFHFLVVASYGHVGDSQAAQVFMERVTAVNPNYIKAAGQTFDYWHTNSRLRSLVVAGLNKANITVDGLT